MEAITKLSVNINKFATLRNSRGGNNPDVVKAAIDAQRFGADGVTVHPRPDERHIRYSDVRQIRKIIVPTLASSYLQLARHRAWEDQSKCWRLMVNNSCNRQQKWL